MVRRSGVRILIHVCLLSLCPFREEALKGNISFHFIKQTPLFGRRPLEKKKKKKKKKKKR